MPIHTDRRDFDSYLHALLKDGRTTRIEIMLQNGATQEVCGPFVVGKRFIRGSAGNDPSAYRTCIFLFDAIARITPMSE
jgi:hypothetical protein